MIIKWTKTRVLANGKKVIAGTLSEDMSRKEAKAYILNGVAKESKDVSTIHGDN